MSSSPFYTEDHAAFRLVVRQFTEKEIVPYIPEWEKAGEVPRMLYKKAAEINININLYILIIWQFKLSKGNFGKTIIHRFPQSIVINTSAAKVN